MAIIGEIKSPGRLVENMSPGEYMFPNGVPEDTQRRWDEAMAVLEESERAVDAMARDPNIIIRAGALSVDSQTRG